MELVFLIYLIEVVLGVVRGAQAAVLIALLVFVPVALCGLLACGVLEEENLKSTMKRYVMPIYIWGAGIFFVLSFLPSTDTAYKMVAVYGATELVQMEEVQEIGGKSLEVINKVMDDYLGKIEADK